jgi:hypothetical protein
MAAYCKVSTPAKRLFTRLMEGKFYPVQWGNESRYWLELQAAGLVASGGRISVMRAAYVPVGTKPFVCETFPTWPPLAAAGDIRPKRGTP